MAPNRENGKPTGAGQSPLVSVVMAVYNAEKYLDEAIQSIRRQTLTDFEFIIVNDGSTDQTPEILRRHAAEDSRIRVLEQPNRGLTYSLNRGCRDARGKYIARMDADDISLPDRLAKQVSFLESHPHVAVVGGAVQFCDERGELGETLRMPPQPDAVQERLWSDTAIIHPTAMLRKAVFEEMGGYRFPHSEDYDLWLRIADKYDLANLEDIVLFYRTHADQKCAWGAIGTALMVLAARHCARVRRATGQDPARDCEVLDHKSLLRIGVSPKDIEQAVLSVPLLRVQHLLERGEWRAARSLLVEIDRVLSDLRANRAERSDVAYGIAKTHLGERNYPAWVRWILRAYGFQPSRILQMFKHRIRSFAAGKT